LISKVSFPRSGGHIICSCTKPMNPVHSFSPYFVKTQVALKATWMRRSAKWKTTFCIHESNFQCSEQMFRKIWLIDSASKYWLIVNNETEHTELKQ